MTVGEIARAAAKVPSKPLSPKDPRVNLMRESDGPFRCDRCIFWVGAGKSCEWQTARLKAGDCCNQFLPKKK